MNRQLRSIFITAFALLLPFVLWEVGVLIGWLDDRFLPPPSRVVPVLFTLLGSHDFLTHMSASMVAIGFGVLLSLFLGVATGLVASQSAFIDRIISPNVELIRGIAPLALWPAFMLIFGLGIVAKVAMIFWVAWIPIFLSTLQGIRAVAPDHLRVARLFRASRWQLAQTIYFPSALPFLIVGLRLAVGNAFLAIVAAEMIGSSSGLGFYILETSQTFRLKEMYASILMIGIIGLTLNSILIFWESRASLWRRA